MIGGLHLTHAGARESWRKRQKVSHVGSVSQDDQSHAQIKASTKALVSASEYGEARRAPNYIVRLHAAKYLQCDPLFKDLFFPLLHYAKNFGFCSTTGVGNITAGLNRNGSFATPDNPSTWSKANGCYRGLSVFTVRSSYMDKDDVFKLNSTAQQIGYSDVAGGWKFTKSAYRRFNNGPPTFHPAGYSASSNPVTGNFNGGTTYDPKAQTLSWAAVPDDDADFNQTKMQISEVGNLMEDIENGAVHASNFTASVGSGTHQEGTSSTITQPLQTAAGNWDGLGSIYDGSGFYYPNFRNTTIRIADGKLEMDITNGKNSSCLIELVINSQKKLGSSWTPQNYFDEVYQAVQFQQNQSRSENDVLNDNGIYENVPGGWQAFYDPEYPLLHVKSAHKKKIDAMVNEVHRSSHMLAPGQTKKISIALGSLYYGLFGKADTDSTDRMKSLNSDFSAGSLIIAIGHSGVSQLSMPTANTDVLNTSIFANKPDTTDSAVSGSHTVAGAGFWVGKTKAPSEIVVQGRYLEKYYPSYALGEQRGQYDDTSMLPPFVQWSDSDTQRRYLSLPSGLPVQETIGTVDATNQSVATKVSSAEKGPF